MKNQKPVIACVLKKTNEKYFLYEIYKKKYNLLLTYPPPYVYNERWLEQICYYKEKF